MYHTPKPIYYPLTNIKQKEKISNKETEHLPVMRIKTFVTIVSHHKHMSFWHNLQTLQEQKTISHVANCHNQ
jgi:hypothetical protein